MGARMRTKLGIFQFSIVVCAIVALPVTGYGQEATLSGTVTDSTGGVLPGVTVTALHEASGNTFVTVTDGQGAYRLPVRTGLHRITVELSGFATVTRSVELLVGQQAVANLQMAPATVAESVTVTGEAPLIDTTQSSLGGNIDPRQMQELPVNGRNWLALTMLAPGARANSVNAGGAPTAVIGTFRLNVDGQDVTGNCCGTGHQTVLAQDAIAEFEFVSNRFDATQGRSAGMQVNVITKSGTNTTSGSFSGYFRNDRFNAADFVAGRVLPYSNQQLSATFGGPIRRDRVHYFANYEFEREPTTITYTSPFPSFNIDQSTTRLDHKAALRVDMQVSPQARFAVRGSSWTSIQPNVPQNTATSHPSAARETGDYSDNLSGAWTQVLSNRTVNEVKVGWAGIHWYIDPKVNWAQARGDAFGRPGRGTPSILLRGYQIGTPANYGQRIGQDMYSVRDDFTRTYSMAGRHTLKVGGEYQKNDSWLHWCYFNNTEIVANNAPVPANIEQLFPVWDDPSTWNIAALSPITLRVRFFVGQCPTWTPRNVVGGWAQDDWTVGSRLTLNLGVRADKETGAFANSLALPPFLEANRPNRTGVSPRLGAAYSVTDRTVIRGGFGTYYSQVINTAAYPVHNQVYGRVPEPLNDGRPDFAINPWNGPFPTIAQVDQTLCNVNPAPGCVRRGINQGIPDPNSKIPFAYQASVGLQQQVGKDMAVEADYVFTGIRFFRTSNVPAGDNNINLSYNPATGANYPFTDVSRLPYPDWGIVLMTPSRSRSNYHGLQTSFRKRLSNQWQAQGTYTLSRFWDGTPAPLSGLTPVTFPLAADLGAQYGPAVGDQRHRAVVNGIFEAGYGFQLSGLYFFGSGERVSTSYGGDLRLSGLTTGRLRPDGTIVPRNNFVGKPLHRVDLRVQRRFELGSRTRLDGILEVFNLFNHANYGSYVTVESNAQYGKPSQNRNVAYQPRMLQLGFRVAF